MVTGLAHVTGSHRLALCEIGLTGRALANSRGVELRFADGAVGSLPFETGAGKAPYSRELKQGWQLVELDMPDAGHAARDNGGRCAMPGSVGPRVNRRPPVSIGTRPRVEKLLGLYSNCFPGVSAGRVSGLARPTRRRATS